VGNANIDASLLSNANYNITATNGTLAISQRFLTVTADAQSKTYGDANPTLTYTAAADGTGTSRGLVNGDSLSGSLSTLATSSTGVGNANIDASLLSNANYNITATNGTLAIAQANATVTANSDTSKVYNGASQSVSGFTVSGLVNNESASVLSGVIAGASGTNAGSYSASAGVGSYSGNYKLSFVDGKLVIGKSNDYVSITSVTDSSNYIYSFVAGSLDTYSASSFIKNNVMDLFIPNVNVNPSSNFVYKPGKTIPDFVFIDKGIDISMNNILDN
jgi:hypothetical protein